MSSMSRQSAGWGPSHQTRWPRGRKLPRWSWALFAPCAAIYYFAWRDWTGMEVMAGTWLLGTVAIEAALMRFG